VKKVVLLCLLALSLPVLAEGREDVPIYDVWGSYPTSFFDYPEQVIRQRQEPFFKDFIQGYEDSAIAAPLRTRDLPTPFNSSLRDELGYAEATQNLLTTTPSW